MVRLKRLENSNLGRRAVIYYLCSENKGTDQLRGDRKSRVSHDAAHFMATILQSIYLLRVRIAFEYCRISLSHHVTVLGISNPPSK